MHSRLTWGFIFTLGIIVKFFLIKHSPMLARFHHSQSQISLVRISSLCTFPFCYMHNITSFWIFPNCFCRLILIATVWQSLVPKAAVQRPPVRGRFCERPYCGGLAASGYRVGRSGERPYLFLSDPPGDYSVPPGKIPSIATASPCG
jgi:hypothetical protein